MKRFYFQFILAASLVIAPWVTAHAVIDLKADIKPKNAVTNPGKKKFAPPTLTKIVYDKVLAATPQEVKIFGTGFGTNAAVVSVTYGADGTGASGNNVQVISDTELRFTPNTLVANQYYYMIVTVDGVSSARSNFVFIGVSSFPTPVINYFSPSNVPTLRPQSIQLGGANLGTQNEAVEVTYGPTGTEFTATVTTAADSYLKITTQALQPNTVYKALVKSYGVSSTVSTVTFTSPASTPIVTNMPYSGAAGSSITITGNYFEGSDPSLNIVYFGSVKATVTAASTTSLTVTIPVGTTIKPLTIINRITNLAFTTTQSFIPTYTPSTHLVKQDYFFDYASKGVATAPLALKTGDFNNDGKTDFVVLTNTTASVYLNTSTVGSLTGSTFSLSTTFTYGNVNTTFQDFTIGDYNNDGYLDLAVLYFSGNSSGVYYVNVLLNNGSNFSGTNILNFSGSAYDVGLAAGDLNGDGKTDFAVTTGNAIYFCININGTYSNLNAVIVDADHIALADMNGDGKLDVICSHKDVNKPSKVILLDESYNAISTTTISSTGGVNDLKVEDLDGDGKPDVIFATATGVAIYQNNSTLNTIAFGNPVTKNTASLVKTLTLADLDGDGKIDICAALGSSGKLGLIKNNSTSGSISLANAVNTIYSTNTVALPVIKAFDIADLDGDGKPDLVVPDYANNNVSLFRQDQTYVLASPSEQATNLTFPSVSDIASSVSWTKGNGRYTAVFIKQANTGTANPTDLSTYNAGNFGVGDQIGATGWYCIYNGVGNSSNIIDLQAGTAYQVMAISYNGSSGEELYNNNAATNNPATLTTTAPILRITAIAPDKGPIGTTVVISGSGFDATASNNIVYFGAVKAVVNSASTTALTVTVPIGASYKKLTVLNKTISLLASSHHPFMVTYPNAKSTVAASHFDIPVGVSATSNFSPSFVVSGDLDGDGKVDIVAVNVNGQLASYRNTANTITNTSFTRTTHASNASSYIMGLQLADFDNDGKLDIAIAGSAGISVLLNTSTGTTISFTAPIVYSVIGGAVNCLTVGDFNNDGKLDLAMGTANSAISILINNSTPGNRSFSTATSLPISAPATAIDAKDIDGDGRVDLAAVNRDSDKAAVDIVRNNGIGTQLSFSDYLTINGNNGFSHIRSFLLEDLNNDGKIDLSLNSGSGGTPQNMVNNSTPGIISFAAYTANPSGFTQEAIHAGDLNGDGLVDELSTYFYPKQLIFSSLQGLYNEGAMPISLVPVTLLYSQAAGIGDVELGDLDGDGRVDLIHATGGSLSPYNTGNIYIYRYNAALLPSIQATNLVFSSIGGKNATISWTNGDAVRRMVFVKAGNNTSDAPLPVDHTIYTANVNFGNGTQIGTTGWYPVYAGTGSSVTVTNLNPGTTYQVMVVESNTNGTTETLYLTTTGTNNPLVFTTQELPIVVAFSPASGPIGTSVTITGTGFNATAANNIVFFGATKATVTAASATSLTVTVPAGSSYEAISVLNTANNLIGYSNKPFLLTAAISIRRILTDDFDAPVNMTTTGTNKRVLIADLDNDGKPEVITIDAVNFNIKIFKNNTSGAITGTSLTLLATIATTTAPVKILAKDLDGDGYAELIYTTGNTVNILQNKLLGTDFNTKLTLNLAATGNNIVISDLNKDGKPDLVVSTASATVNIFKNQIITGTFDANSFVAQTQTTLNATQKNVLIGDMDSDGKLDLIVANSSTNLEFYPGTSTGSTISFGTRVSVNQNQNSADINIADLNDDGKPDLVNTLAGNMYLMRNTSAAPGSFTFSNVVISPIATATTVVDDIQFADFDGDGKVDIAYANTNNTANMLGILRNTSTTTLTFTPYTGIALSAISSGFGIGDIDGDGRPDLIAASNTGTLKLIRNNPILPPTIPSSAINFTNVTGKGIELNWTSGNGTNRIVFAKQGVEVSGVMATNSTAYTPAAFGLGTQIGTTGYYCIYNGTGNSVVTGGYTPNTAYSFIIFEYVGADPKQIYATTGVTGDVTTGIGAPVINGFSPTTAAVGETVTFTGQYFDATPANNIVFFGATMANVTAATATSLTVTVPTGATVNRLTVLNAVSGLTGYSKTGFNTTFTPAKPDNLSGDDFESKVQLGTGVSPNTLAIADIDGDGKSDLVLLDQTATNVVVYRNTASAGPFTANSFAAPVAFAAGTNGVHLTIGDLNGDGKLDVGVANGSTFKVNLLKNISTVGTIAFEPKVELIAGTETLNTIAFADADQDGKLDVFVANSYNVFIFRNQGTPQQLSFATPVTIATGISTTITVGDLNNDGKPDIVCTSPTDNIRVLQNTSVTNSISFSGPVMLNAGPTTTIISIADLNNDGKPDLAVKSWDTNYYFMQNNTPDGGTITSATISYQSFIGSNSADALALGDLNGDGKPDGVMRLGNSLFFARNTSVGSPSFSTQKTLNHALSAQTLAIGDVDGDGRNDVIVVNTDGTISGYRNRPVFAPITQAGNIVFSNVTFGAAKLTWTNGSGERRAVFAKLGNSGSPLPADLTTYTANMAFLSGTQIDATGWYCVYNGTGNTVDVTNLLDETDYQFMVVEYNGSAANEVYLTAPSTNNPATVKTAVLTLPTTQASNVTFSNTTISTTTINWTNGDAIKHAVFMHLGNTGTPVPIDQTTATANTIFGSGASQIGTTGWYCVYNGTGSTVNVTNLANGTAYQVMVIGYNGLAGREKYLTATVATNPVTLNTIAIPKIVSFTPSSGAIGTVVTITGTGFDATNANNIVYFGAVKAQVTAATGTSLTVTVPAGATQQPITVLNTAVNLSAATYTPFVTLFSPTKTPTNAGDFARIDLPIGGTANVVAIGDIDGDGKSDLIVNNYSTGKILIYRNHTNSGAINVTDFDAPLQIIQVTSSASPIKLADVDNDGKLDIIVGNTTASISIYRNTTVNGGPISFAAKVDYTTLSIPLFIAVTDIDLDGKQDIVATGASSVYTILRNASIPNILSFTSSSNSVGGVPLGLGVGDIDSDNKPDLLFTTATALVVQRNTSTIGSTFSFSSFSFNALGSGRTPMATDFNNDGKQDIVTVNNGNNNISVFQNSYNGLNLTASSFIRTDYPIGLVPAALTLGDVDGDGKTDVITANKLTNNFSVLRNTSTTAISFATASNVPSDLGPADVMYADIDGDGRGDVITINQGAVNTLSIFRYNPIVVPTIPATNIVFSDIKSGSATLTWTNGNGTKNAVFAYLGNATIAVPADLTTYVANAGFGLGTQIGTTGWYCVYNGTANTTTVENLTDLTEYKFMVVSYNGTAGYELYIATPAQGNPATATTVGVIAPTVQASNITTANLTATGVTLNFTKGNGSLRAVFMLLGNTGTPAPVDLTTYIGNGNFTSGYQIGSTGWYCVYRGFETTVNVFGLSPATTYQTMVVEFNGRQTGQELYLTSTSTLNPINFTTATPPTITAFSPSSGIAGSTVTITGTAFNETAANNIVYFGGAKATVTAASATSLTVTVPTGTTYQPLSVTNAHNSLTAYSMQPYKMTFLGKATMAATDFTAQVNLAPSTAINTFGTVVGDLNNDGKLDIVATNLTAKTISIYKNNIADNNGFVANDFTMQEIVLTNSPRIVLLHDFNGDGKLDMAVSTTENVVLIFQNTTIGNGLITFGTPIQLTISNAGGMGLSANDIDGDGRPDLAVAVNGSSTGGTVALFRNISNFGTISFNTAYNLTGTAASPYSVLLRDMNGDGKPDLVVSGTGLSAVAIFRNIMSGAADFATGMFGAKVSSSTSSALQALAVGDLDDDVNATVDMVSGTVAATGINLHKNTTANGTATITMATAVARTTSSAYIDFALGDLDGDGKLDLAGTSGAAVVALFKNSFTATGVFNVASFGAPFTLNTGANSGSVALGDLDGDGKLDLVVANRNNAAAGLSLIRNNPVVAPTIQATNLNFASITKTSATLNWTNGNGTARAVFVKVANTGTPAPVDVTVYTANTTFGSGDQIGTSGWFCVYNGTASTVDVTGLTVGAAYQVMVVESQVLNTYAFYNKTAGTNNPKSFSTLSDDATLSAIAVSTGTLNPTFAAATTNYNVSVNKNITNIIITPTTTNANATVTVAGTTPTSPVNLIAGANPITIAVTAQDGTTLKNYIVNVTQLPNVAPTNIMLSATAINENVAAGSTIGTLSATDVDGTTFTYSFVAGTGDTDNAAFAIVGDALRIIASPDYETKSSYNIRLVVTDDGGLTFEKTFVITINDLLDNPIISSTGTLTAFSTTYGVASVSQSFNVSGTLMTAGILITPPAGFEVSADNTTFAATTTIGAAGTIVSTPVYVRLKNSAGVGTAYVGDVVLTSSGASTINVAIPASSVTLAPQTITFAALANKTFGDAVFSLTATGGASGNAVTYTSSDVSVATVSGATVTIVGAGTTIIKASQLGNANYAAATAVDQTLTVDKATQAITFTALANKTFGDSAFSLTATGGASGNAVTYTSSDVSVATVSGATVTIVGAGTTTIKASQLGNANYTAATSVDQSLTVDKATQAINFTALANKTFGDAAFSLTATGGASGNAVTYTSSDVSVATVSGATVTIVGAGTTTIKASQLGNANYAAATAVDQTLTVDKATQAITFTALANKTFGDAAFSLTATGGASGNAVTYTSSDVSVATVSGATVTILGAGTTTIKASQLGNANYTIATSVDQVLTVDKATQVISFATITDKNLNSIDFQPGATTTSGLAITYTSSNTAIATVYQDAADGNKWKIKVLGNGNTDITAIQAGNQNFNAASLTRTLNVVPVTLPVALTSYTAKIDGNRSRLSWTTAAEQNNERFEIERSVDGKVFVYLATVKGNGTTSNSHTYAVYDNNPGNGTTYYRLKQYDFNGRAEELGVRSVNFKVEAVMSVKAFPNPTTDAVNLSFANYNGEKAKIVLTDMLGRTIHSETILLTTGVTSYQLNLNIKLTPGQYFINISGEGLKKVIKLIAN